MSRFLTSTLGRIFTLVLAIYLGAFWSATPASGSPFVWQIERMEPGDQAWIQTGFTQYDLAFAWEDTPPMFFPLKVTQIDVWWGSELNSPHHLATNIVFYDYQGVATYLLEGAVLASGLNPIRMPVECAPCEVIFDQAPIAVALQYLGEFDRSPPVSQGGGHIVTGNAGCWPGFDFVFDWETQQWTQPCPGLNGNFTFRVHFEALCPERIGDVDGDGDIDLSDHALLVQAMAGPGIDIWDSPAIYDDLDNDYDVDLRDWAILQANFMNGAQVSCGSARQVTHPGELLRLTPEGLGPADAPNLPEAVQRLPELLKRAVPTRANAGSEVTSRTPRGDTREWTLRQVSIALVLVAIFITLFVGPCISASCRNSNRAAFMAGGTEVSPGSIEEQRIRAAMDRLQLWGGCHADAEQAWFALSALQFYNPWLGNPQINYSVSEDDTEFAASRLFNQVVIHHTFVTGDHWDALVNQCGEACAISGLALFLFTEWQHIDDSSAREELLQVRFVTFKNRLKQCGLLPTEGLLEEFGHGFGD